MKKNQKRVTVLLGVICVFLTALSAWYSVTFNDSRLILPMEFSQYTFRMQDLPMLLSCMFLALYVLYLFGLLIKLLIESKRKEAAGQATRNVDPSLGFLGFCGFFGFLGFWTYSVDKTIFPFIFFMFFGYFGFFYEGKMSNTFMDERYRENQMKAHMTANKIALSIILFAVLILGQGKLMGNLEYTLIALIIVVSLAIALEVFLSEYLLYHYDHDEQSEESGE